MPGHNGSAGRAGKANGRTPAMNVTRESDTLVVPAKSPNEAAPAAKEAMEGRSVVKGSTCQQNMSRTQCRQNDMQSALERVRQAAIRDKGARFTSIFHHLSIERLRQSFDALKKKASPGVDGVTWAQYEANVDHNILRLHTRLHHGAYRARPSRRVYIPKPDGRQRPLGVAALEDKIVQRAATDVMNAIYETDFLGFSYGFRPGRGAHDALDALTVGIERKKVNWVLDADIRGFFDAINHDWMLRFVEHRIGDSRMLRLIRKWMKAGVLEDGKLLETTTGTPQGATVSPLLANLYLHHVFDLWVQQWRSRHSFGDMIVTRYADDFVVGFQHRGEALKFLKDLRDRFAKFGLELHPNKTRLICFGRFAAEQRAIEGHGKPETFSFLGFTHICAKSRDGKYALRRKTDAKRMRGKLAQLRAEILRRRHQSISDQGRWLSSVLRGYFAYYAVPTNIFSLGRFRSEVGRAWFRALHRRSQRHALTWPRMQRLQNRWLPHARILHPWPGERFDAKTQDRSRVR